MMPEFFEYCENLREILLTALVDNGYVQYSDYVLKRADQLQDAAELIRAENPEICAQLR